MMVILLTGQTMTCVARMPVGITMSKSLSLIPSMRRNAKITDKLFYKLWKDALAQPDKEMYIGEYGYPEWFDEISTDSGKIIEILGNIHDVAHMSVRDIISAAGLTQAAFAVKFCIPLRTVEDWATGKRRYTDYIRLMLAESLGLVKKAAG